MRKATFAALLAALAFPAPAPAIDQQTAGDVVSAVVTLAAFGQTYNKDDAAGRRQYFWNVGTELVVNTALRGIFQETELGTRPNGHKYGFPSGHVGFVMAQAGFLGERYGWEYGVPAYLATAYVGWTRIESDHHYWRDIVAAAAVSQAIAMLTVTAQDEPGVEPVIGAGYAGLRWRFR